MRRLWLGVALGLAACRGGPVALPGAEQVEDKGADGAAVGEAGEPAATPSKAPARPAPSASEGGASSAGANAPGDATSTTLSGGAADVAEGCGAQPVTLAEAHSGRVRSNVPVSLGPLLASSQKFLVSEAKSGSCLWGAFAADPQQVGAGSGLFLVSFGAKHADGEACLPGSDGLPDDLRPGDALHVEGKLEDYAPAACDGTAPAQQLVVDAACPVRRHGRADLPEPARLDAALATRLATGNDAALLRDWSGALVRLETMSATQDEDDGDAVFPFGVVRLAETSLEVHSRLYYFDLSDGGPRAAGKAPHYGFPTAFRSVTGVVFLDYCSWVLAPRDRCTDLVPASSDCAN